MSITYERPVLNTVLARLKETKSKIIILSGARQVGKTTIAIQALKKIAQQHLYIIVESGFDVNWIEQQWARARALSKANVAGAVLVIDEIQKISQWSERVKRLWDEDVISNINLKVLLLGSSSLLLHKGLTESMAGRYEIINIPHWSYFECKAAFDLSLDEYLYFGGYPGALIYKHDEDRFFAYMQDAIIEPIIGRDILSQFVVHKPALLRQLFFLGSEYSGQILSYNKILGQLQDAGNTTTLAHYLQLLQQSEVLAGLHKYAQQKVRQRQSSPKFQVFNNALMTSVNHLDFNSSMHDSEQRGRLVESAIGVNLKMDSHREVYYWREDNKEVDFVVKYKQKLIAIEVKSGKKITAMPGVAEFAKKFAPTNILLIGIGGIPIEEFLTGNLDDFI